MDNAAGELLGIRGAAATNLITLSQRYEKQKKLNGVASVVVTMLLALGLFVAILHAFDRNQSGTVAFSVWGVLAALGLAGCLLHKSRCVHGVTCYGAVGLSMPSRAAADEIKQFVDEFKDRHKSGH